MGDARTYEFVFSLAGQEDIIFPASGGSPCKARNQAFETLEGILKRLDLPSNGWKLVSQTEKDIS